MRASLTLPLSLALLLIVATGCGGNASPAPTSTTPPPPPTATAPATPSPNPPPPTSGGGGSSTAPFQQTLSAMVNWTDVGDYGLVSVSATGDVTIQVNGATKNATYSWSFCEFSGTCFDLAQMLVTDGSGNGQLTFHFPKTGNWAGYFSGKSTTGTIDTQDAAHHSMKGNLVSDNGVNGSAPCDRT